MADRPARYRRGVAQMRQYGWLVGALLGIAFAATAMVLQQTELMRRFELVSLDTRFRAERTAKIDPRIIIVAIDDSSVRQLGRWPWPREFHAALLQAFN